MGCTVECEMIMCSLADQEDRSGCADRSEATTPVVPEDDFMQKCRRKNFSKPKRPFFSEVKSGMKNAVKSETPKSAPQAGSTQPRYEKVIVRSTKNFFSLLLFLL